MSSAQAAYAVGVDVGGTFTDVVVEAPDGLSLMKIPTTRGNP